MSDAMPDRYRPDPVIDIAVSERPSGSHHAHLPILALRDWLGISSPTSLPVAPHDTQAVHVGPGVPTILGTVTVAMNERANREYPDAKLPPRIMRYLDVTDADRLEVEHVDDGILAVRQIDPPERASTDGGPLVVSAGKHGNITHYHTDTDCKYGPHQTRHVDYDHVDRRDLGLCGHCEERMEGTS